MMLQMILLLILMSVSLIMEFNMKEIIFTDPSKGYAIEVTTKMVMFILSNCKRVAKGNKLF